MSAAFNKFDVFVADLANKIHNLGSDTLKLMLSNTIPVRTNTVLSNITEITPQNGYSAGGAALTGVTATQTSGLMTLAGTAPVFTASGGSFGPFEYIVLYNSTASGKNLIGWFDYGSALSINSGDSYTPTVSGSGVLTVQ